ncbi:MAG: hypothetical protein B7Z80_08060 [Rhodospirillales bacterium 20-64-7]|nr:MAG: hypothetical protein B7Z80_08060 [Rhodospirillales bacterium 20-64-7]
MTPESVMTLAQQAMEITVLISAPMLLASLAIGLLVSIFQAATSINEMTLSFIPKLIAMAAVPAQAQAPAAPNSPGLGTCANSIYAANRITQTRASRGRSGRAGGLRIFATLSLPHWAGNVPGRWPNRT